MHYIDISIIFCYLMTIFVVGLLSSKNMKSVKEYAVANKNYTAPILFATFSASYIGGGFSLGNADSVFNQGMCVATALLGFSVTLLLVALFIAPRVAKLKNYCSVGDILEPCFGKKARLLAGILGSCVCIGILGAQVGAIGAVFAQLTPFTYFQGVIIGCGMVILYTSFGGMKAVVITDVIQFFLLFICIPLSLFMGISYIGGWQALHNAVPADYFNFFTTDNFSIWAWIALFLSFMIGETLTPAYTQRLMIAKTPKQTQKGLICSAFLTAPFFIMTGLIGLVAYTINKDMASNLAMPTVIQMTLPVGLKGFACAAILAVVMSTADTFLNAATVSLVEDVIKPLSPKKYFDKNPKKALTLIKVLSLFIGIGSVIVALNMSNLIEILLISYNFWGPIMLMPLVCILMDWKIKPKTFWYSTIITGSFLLLGTIFNIKVGDFDLLVVCVGINALCLSIFHNVKAFSQNQSA